MKSEGVLLDDNTVRFERLLPGPIERVWSYLAEGDKRAKWLCGGETEPRVGGHVDMLFHNASLSGPDDIERPEKYREYSDKITFSGTVTHYEPPRVLAHTWDFEGDSSEVRYELSEQGDKVLLVLTHTRLNSTEEIISVCGGWHTHLDVLVDVLENQVVRPFWATLTENEAEYVRRLRG